MIIKNKKRRKTFKTNQDYFDWLNKNKEQIKNINLKILKDRIKVEFEERNEENG